MGFKAFILDEISHLLDSFLFYMFLLVIAFWLLKDKIVDRIKSMAKDKNQNQMDDTEKEAEQTDDTEKEAEQMLRSLPEDALSQQEKQNLIDDEDSDEAQNSNVRVSTPVTDSTVTMNSSDMSRCPSCNSDIHQCRRFCDNCGHRFNQTIAKESLCTGKIDDSPCYNVITSRIKFCGNCGTQNKSYIADNDIKENNTSGSCLQSDQDANQADKWEPYKVDVDTARDSTTKVSGDIQKNDDINKENDEDTKSNLDPQEMENDSTTRVSGDIQKNDDTNKENDGDTKSNLDPQEMENDISLNEIFAQLKRDGISETTSYIRQKLNEVKTRILKFAVIGRSAVGKSSFINMMLGLQPGNICYAETGAGDTTKNKYAYQHPKNDNITFWDMPGFGTMEMTIETFSSEFGFELNTFDYFFFFIDSVIMEGDLWLLDKIQGFGTPYCFVRSKLDLDLVKGRTKEEIREKLETSMQKKDKVKGSALFLISTEKSYLHTGDFRQLFSHIIKHLPLAKAESFSFFLPILTPEVIEEKFQSLQKRIKYIALSAGVISAIPIPFLDIGVNIYIVGREIKLYHEVFLLDKNMAKNVPGVKHKKTSSYDIQKKLMTALRAVTNVATVGTVIMSQADVLVPGVGSVAAGGASLEYARQYLNKTLIEMKKDAHSVYEHYSVK